MLSPSGRLPALAAILLASSVTASTIRTATFIAWGTDPANYVITAKRWARADVFGPNPLEIESPRSSAGVALGNRQGLTPGTDISIYPLGFPVFLAAADLVNPEFGVYLVPPIFLGVLVLATFAIASRLAGPWGGLLAAAMTAATPIALAHTVTVMSDVPAAALLLLAVALSDGRSALSPAAAGAAMAAAVMTRPILAPLALVPAVLVLTAGSSRMTAWREWRWGRALLFGLVAAIGPLMVLWSQDVLYGGPFNAGYPGWEEFFSTDRIPGNLSLYPRLLVAVHTPLAIAGLAGAVPLAIALSPDDPGAARLTLGLVAIVLMNFALYLPYLSYDHVWSLRFMLPAIVALFVLLAAISIVAARAVSRWHKALAAVAIVPLVIVAGGGMHLYPFVFGMFRGDAHAGMMGRYLREVLPPKAAVISSVHSAAVAHYTGRQVVRFDLLDPPVFDAMLDVLVRRGYHPVFLIDQENEGAVFKERFPASRYRRLDWRPRAMFIAGTTLWYLDFADRDRGRDPARAPTDVLR